jgi:polysaccharide pyruvyl transferase WcaK-like protein
MHDTPPTILFLGTHGQHNIGDELLLETFLHQLGDEPSYVINTYDEAFTANQLAGRYRAELIDTAGDRRSLMRHLLTADAVVFGGGSIVKELNAATGRNRYATMLMILAVVTLARLVARAPICMLNIGVGPIRSRMGRFLARIILSQADLVTVRDPGSYALCQEMGLGDRVRSGTDAVFSVSPEWLLSGGELPAERPAERPAADGPVRIALNLNHDIENPSNWEHFQSQLAEAIRHLAAGRDIELHGLPMQSKGKDHDDATVLRDFTMRIPEVPFVEHRPTTHADAARLIRSCDLMLSERLHAIVMASILGVPAFALAYDVKVTELTRMLGLEDASVDINRAFGATEISGPVGVLLDDLEGAGARLRCQAGMLATSAQADFAQARLWLQERAS